MRRPEGSRRGVTDCELSGSFEQFERCLITMGQSNTESVKK
jgi:hypothetical protein